MNAKNTINKAQLAALTGTTSAKAKRNTQPQYRLVKKQCERPGCTMAFQSYPGAYHPYCSLECCAAMDPEYFCDVIKTWALGEVTA